MKKIFYIFASIMIAITLCLSISATEIVETEVPEIVEGVTVETESPEIIDAALNLLEEYRLELIEVGGTSAIVAVSFLIKLLNDKKTRKLDRDVSIIKGDTLNTNTAQTSVVSAVNGMIDGYNAMKTSYDKYGLTEDERNRVVGALVAQNTAILEILMVLSVNNKNLPQGAKDLVLMQYATCLKTLEDDAQLKAIVESVRENIGTNQLIENTSMESDGNEE